MVKVGKWIAKHKVLVLLIGLLLVIPSVIGIAETRVNYDLLSYMNIALLSPRKYNRFAILNNTPFEKERRTMSKTNIKCPRCNSDKLYKFGMNKQAKQKYQCKQCKRQFAIGDGDGRPKLNNPKCPRCGKGTYLHHSYKHYNRYKCNNKKCNHIIVKHHTTNIDTASSELVSGSLSMKGMRFPLHVILTALTLYFLNNSSTRAISQFLMINSGIPCYYSKLD